MSWSLIVGGANVTGFVHNGARFREIASSTDGNATFTLNGAHAACVPGAWVTLASGDTLIWEGTIDSSNAQYDNSGNVVATMVHAVPLAAQLDVAGGLSVTQPTDVATVAQALADLTGFPWAGPAEYGIAVGALNIAHVGTALTTAATIVRSTWSIRNGALVFNASENITPTPIPASLSGVATAASQVVVRGGLDAITRQPLQGLFIPPGSPTGPVYQTTHASVADSPTLAVLGAAIAERYDQNAQSGSVLLPYTVPIIRAGDFVIDLNEVIAVVHEVIYTLTGGQCTPTITFGFPALSISPVYSAELHDLSVQSPVARLHDGYVVQGGDLTASGLSVSLDTLVAVVNGTSAVVNPDVFNLAPNSTVRINATPAAYVVTDDLTTPAPGSAIALWQVSTNASGVIGQVDLRTHGSIGVANFQSAAYAAPTITSPSASAVAAVDGVTTDVTISATFTNIPAENTASQIAWYFRTAGTSLWSFWAAEVLPGLPNPAASQTLSFLFAGLQNGGDYDFGAAYVGIRGDAGPISVVESAFATGPLNIPAGDGPPMPSSVKTNGPTVTASSLGSAVGLGSGSYAQPFSVTVGDWTAGANPTWFEELLFFKRQHGDTNAIPVGAISANTTGLTYASTADLPASNLGWDIGVAYLDAAGQTSAIVWPAALNAADAPMNPIYILPGGAAAPAPAISGTPTITPTGVVAGLTDSCALSFALSNQPTDSSLTRIALWLRASGASAWTPYAQVAPVSGGSYALDMTDLTSGTGYDFGVSYVGLGGSESPVTLIGSASASALALKTSYLAQGSGAAPTLSVAASFSTVPSVSGITSDVTVAFTTNNQPADGSFSGLAVYFGTAGGTLGLYAVIPPTGGAYSFTFPALNDGATYAFAIAYVSTNQTSGTELSLGTYAVPALAVPPGAIATGTYAAPTTSSAATDTVEGATSAACDVIVTAPFNNVPASPANGIRWFFRASGTTDWGVSGDTALSATTFKFSGLVNGGTYDFGAAYVGIRHDDVGAITELLASVLASPLAIPGGSLEAMPSAIKTSGPTLSSESVTARVLGIGLVQILTATFTETDFTATPAWIAKMTLVGRITGTTNTTFERAISPQSSVTGTYSSTPFPMTTGDEIDLGLYYTDLQGNVSATVWPAGWGAISDPNGAYFDGGNGYVTPVHGRMSTATQSRIGSDKTLHVDGTTGPVSGEMPLANHDPTVQTAAPLANDSLNASGVILGYGNNPRQAAADVTANNTSALTASLSNQTQDGLADGTTYARSLATYLKSGRPYTFQGAWVSTTAYNPGDEVTEAGNYYLCLTANTNVAPPGADWQLLGPATADNIIEGTNKFAAEHGADITGNHTANDTAHVNAIAAASISPIANLMPAEAGADVTSTHTAADTTNVSGVASATVAGGAGRANAAIDSGDIVVAAGLDLSRAYTNKTLDYVPAGLAYRSVPLSAAQGQNLLENAGFETPALASAPAGTLFTNWTDYGGSADISLIADTDAPYSGFHDALLSTNSNIVIAANTDIYRALLCGTRINCIPSDVFSLAGYINTQQNTATPSGITYSASLIVRFFTAAGAFVSDAPAPAITAINNLYTFTQAQVTVPATASYCQVYLESTVDNTTGSAITLPNGLIWDARFDQISLIKATRLEYEVLGPLPYANQSTQVTTAIDTSGNVKNLGGTAAASITPIATLMPAEAGADVTSTHTSALTASLSNQTQDGLADGTTYARSLATYLKSGRPYTFQGAWVSTTAYNPGDEVTESGNYYLCLTANTNVAPPGADWQLLGPATSDNIIEGTNKFAAEHGADITGNHTANDTAHVNAIAAASISPIANLMPAEAGADVTSTHTAADTTNVSGVAAATVAGGAGRANAAIDSGDIVVAAGLDLSRAYTNKTLDYVPAGLAYRSVPLSAAQGQNLLENAGFETPALASAPAGTLFTNWTDYGGSADISLIADTDAPYSGFHDALLSTNSNIVIAANTDIYRALLCGTRINCIPSDVFSLAGYINTQQNTATPSGITYSASLIVRFFTAAGAFVSDAPAPAITAINNLYTFTQAQVTVPATASYCQVYLESTVDNTTGSAITLPNGLIWDARFDQISLIKATRLEYEVLGPLPYANQSTQVTTAIDTSGNVKNLGGTAAASITPIATLMPAEAGADVTSTHTSALTASLSNQTQDGLADGTTYARSLATYLKSGRPYTFQGAWVSTTAYNPGDEVTESGNYYLCLTANTNVAPPGADWQLLGPATSDNIIEGTNKFAAEHGADITGNHTANDTAHVNAIAAASISPIANLMPAEAGADVTSTHTAADTTNVSGVAAATVAGGAGRANAAIDSGDIVVAAGLDLSRAYTNKTLDYVPAGLAYRSVPLSAAQGQNLLENAGFETPALASAPAGTLFTNWTDYGGSADISLIADTDAPYSGFHDALLSTNSNIVIAANTDIYRALLCGTRINCIPSDVFSLAGYINTQQNTATPSGITYSASLIVRFFTAAGAFVSDAPAPAITAINNLYTFTQAQVTVPATASYCQVYLESTVDNTTGSAITLPNGLIWDARFDQISLIKATRLEYEVLGPLPYGNQSSEYQGNFGSTGLALSTTMFNDLGICINNTAGNPGFSYTSTTTSIDFTIPATTYTRSDGSTVDVTQATPSFGSLTASTTYFFNLYYDAPSGLFGAAKYTSAPSAATTLADCYAEGRIVVAANISITTPATGSGSGSGKPGSGVCPADYQSVETQERGTIRADELEVGMHLPLEDRWVRINKLARCRASLWRYIIKDVDGIEKPFDVTATHAVLKADGEWCYIKDLLPDAPLYGGARVIRSHYLAEGDCIEMEVEGHVYSFGGATAHNISL